MGRKSTRAITKNEVFQIDLASLFRDGYIELGQHMGIDVHLKDGPTIFIESNLKGGKYWLRLRYTIVVKANNIKHTYDYKIFLNQQPSNLNKGNILSFICPKSGLKARTLYLCPDSYIFKHRKAFSKRLYYNCQMSSKLNRCYEKDKRYKSIIQNLQLRRRNQTTYKGALTRQAKRIQKLKDLQNKAAKDKWLPSSMPVVLRRAVFGYKTTHLDFKQFDIEGITERVVKVKNQKSLFLQLLKHLLP